MLAMQDEIKEHIEAKQPEVTDSREKILMLFWLKQEGALAHGDIEKKPAKI